MSRPLTADELGEAGESNLKLLCDKAGLVCNKSTRDVTGWDFIVEFPMPECGSDVALDRRSTTECRIQLKSTLGGGDSRISLRLSSVEFLAKNVGPALIVAFLLHSNGDGIAGYIIHVIGENLARVLKRLRSAQASDTLAINRAKITFDYRKMGTLFEFTPEGLRDALASACGNDPARYANEKQRQLTELGYENGRFQANALIWVDGPEHLKNILLGLTPIKPKQLQVFDCRFGIQIPYRGTSFEGVEELTLNPPHLGPCQVSIRGPVLAPSTIFAADAFIGPPISEIGGPPLLIRNSDFAITLQPPRVEFSTLGDFNTATRPLQRWIDLLRALVYLGSGQACITISAFDRFSAISLPVDQPIDGPYRDQLPQLQQFLEGWQQFINRAGVVSRAEFSIEEIWASSSAQLAVAAWLNSASTTYLEFQNLADYGLNDDTVHALYFNSAEMGDAAVTYSAKVTIQRIDDPEWPYRSTAFELLDIRSAGGDLQQYAAEQADSHNLRIVIDPRNITLAPRPAASAPRSGSNGA